MCEGNAQMQVFHCLTLEKTSNKSGSFKFFDDVEGRHCTFSILGLFPFKKIKSSNQFEPIPAASGDPDTPRQRLFEACVHLLRLANDGKCAPRTFVDSTGQGWCMEPSAEFWLRQNGEWHLESDEIGGQKNLHYVKQQL